MLLLKAPVPVRAEINLFSIYDFKAFSDGGGVWQRVLFYSLFHSEDCGSPQSPRGKVQTTCFGSIPRGKQRHANLYHLCYSFWCLGSWEWERCFHRKHLEFFFKKRFDMVDRLKKPLTRSVEIRNHRVWDAKIFHQRRFAYNFSY